MSASESHPDLIAWVSGASRPGPGAVPGSAESDIAAHLRGCEACRTEAEALRSMRRSLRASEEAHLSIETLLEIEAAGMEGEAGKDGVAERHLSRCGECRADLDALLRAGRARVRMEKDRPPARGGAAGRRALLAWAAAAVIAVVSLGVLRILRSPAPESKAAPSSEPFVVFSAPSRGAAGLRTLIGGGPATVRVALPFGAEGGAYEARLERPDGAIVVNAETRILKDGELIEARLDVPAEQGDYRLTLVPMSGRGQPIVYPIHVVASQGSPLPKR